jgi:hypothetical protein
MVKRVVMEIFGIILILVGVVIMLTGLGLFFTIAVVYALVAYLENKND